MVIPPGLTAGDLVLDLTAEPGAPRPSGALLEVRAATAAGRGAAQRSRLGREAAAADQWERCAGAWAAVGDQRRAATARAYAVDGPGGGPGRRGSAGRVSGAPILADLLDG